MRLFIPVCRFSDYSYSIIEKSNWGTINRIQLPLKVDKIFQESGDWEEAIVMTTS